MGFSSSWSVEAKEFEVVVVGGESGIRIRESCKGRHRSILLDRSELAWLLRTFESLVCVEDSRVFLGSVSVWIPADHCATAFQQTWRVHGDGRICWESEEGLDFHTGRKSRARLDKLS